MFCFFGRKKRWRFLSCCNLLNHPSLFYYFITTQKGYCWEAIVANIVNFYTVVGKFLHNSDFLPSKTCKLLWGYMNCHTVGQSNQECKETCEWCRKAWFRNFVKKRETFLVSVTHLILRFANVQNKFKQTNKTKKKPYQWQLHQVWGFFTFLGDPAYCVARRPVC